MIGFDSNRMNGICSIQKHWHTKSMIHEWLEPMALWEIFEQTYKYSVIHLASIVH